MTGDASWLWNTTGGTTSSLSYLWSTGATTASITVNPAQTTTYTVTISSGSNSCTDSIAITVANTGGQLFGQDTLSVCSSSAILDAGSGNTSYSWSTGLTTQSISATNSDWYTCTVTNGNCSVTDSIYIDLFNANILNNDTTICTGASINLQVEQPAGNGSQQAYFNDFESCNLNDFTYSGGSIGITNSSFQGSCAVNMTHFAGQQPNNFYPSNLNFGYGTYSVMARATAYISDNNMYLFQGNNLSGGLTIACLPNNTDNPGFYVNGLGISYGTTNINVTQGQWYEMKVEVFPSIINVYVAGSLRYSTTNFQTPTPGRFKLGVAYSGTYDNMRFIPYNANQSTYLWSTGATTVSINVTPSQTTTYYVTVSNGITTCTDSVTITVNQLPAELFAQDTLAACGSSVTLDAGGEYFGYTWNTGASTQTIPASSSGWYTCTVNNGGCLGTDSVYVSLVDASISQQDTAICLGGSITLNAGNGNPGNQTSCQALPANLQQGLVAYYPFCGNPNDESGNGNNGTPYGASLSSDRFGNPNSAYSFDGIDDYIGLPSIFTTSSNFSINLWIKNQADSTNFGTAGKCFVSGNRSGPLDLIDIGYHPDIPNRLLFGIYNINNNGWHWLDNQESYNGRYAMLTLTYSSSQGMRVYVDGVLKLTNTYMNGWDPSIMQFYLGKSSWPNSNINCIIDDVGFWNRDLTSTEITQLLNTNNYLWSTGDTTASINVTPTQTTTYYVTVTNGITTCTDSVTITVNLLPAELFAQDTLAACGSSVTLDCGGEYFGYTWNTGATTQTISASSSGWYTCTVNNGGCLGTDSIYVSLLDVSIAQNDTAICLGGSITLNTTVNGSPAAGNGNLQLVDQFTMTFGGPFSRTVNTTIGSAYSMSISGSWDTFCDFAGGKIDAAYSRSIGNPTWNPTNLANTIYGAVVHWNNQQVRPTPDVYNPSHVYNYPQLTATQSSQTFQFTDSPYGDNCGSLNFSIYKLVASVDYLWSNGATTASISVTPAQTTTYYVTVSNGISSCTDSVTITVNPPDTTVVTTTECESITWNGQTYTQSGTYTYVTSNAAGCDSVVVLDLTISPLVVNATSTSCSAYGSYDGSATASVSGGNATYSYVWNTVPVQTTATATGLPTGEYTVTVTDNKGCIATSTVTVNQPGYVCGPFRTYGKGGWGAVNNGFNPGTYLVNNFAAAYPNGLQIGSCNRFIQLTSAAAVTAFLPTSGTPARLPNTTLANPTASSYSNTLAGHLVALNLNLTFDSLNPGFAGATVMFKNAIIATGPFVGYTVQQLYDEANQAIGCSNNKSYLSSLNNALDNTNASWRNGVSRNGFVICPGNALAREIPSNFNNREEQARKFVAYPNPTGGLLRLQNEGEIPQRIYLFNLMGELMMDTPWRNELDLGVLPNGLYIVRAQYADGSSEHQRIEVQR
jgi:hypothetical protein